MSNVTSLVFRHMRAPLLVLIGAYAVAILGFVLIPGVDDAGRPWRMDFFHALYFVSYMSTTIGFGELPHPFADHLAIALHSPGLYLLQDWITGVPHSALAEPLYPPRGTWILCGYGRFGKAVRRYLEYEGIPTRIIEALPDLTDSPEGTVAGKGTEAVTPREANIQSAVGLVAGTDNDADNLSIIMTALELKPDLFVVARQNKRQHDRLFQAVESQLVMQPARIIVRRILALISTPLTAGAVDQPQVRQAPRSLSDLTFARPLECRTHRHLHYCGAYFGLSGRGLARDERISPHFMPIGRIAGAMRPCVSNSTQDRPASTRYPHCPARAA